MRTLFQIYQAIGTTGDNDADKICQLALSLIEKLKDLEKQHPDVFDQAIYPLDDNTEDDRTYPENFL